MNEQVASYIGRKKCGCIVWAMVDDEKVDRKHLARELAKAVRAGLIIERVTVEYVRENMFGCKCEPMQKTFGGPRYETT